jgi:ketosteroid isomerase-like protein
MSSFDLSGVIEESHRALDAFVKGDPKPLGALYSRREGITLANPFGPPARGWIEVSETMGRAATNYRDGHATGFERISDDTAGDLAYILEIERYMARIGGAGEVAPVALRVTTIFRREDDGWHIVHRHADPITTPRGAESVLP